MSLGAVLLTTPMTFQKSLEISREKIATLQPEFRERVRAWFNDCLDAGLHPYVYEGLRTPERQAQLFARGPKVTKAAPGYSFHQYGRAIDFAPLVNHPKAQGLFELDWDESAYQPYYAIAKKHGLRSLSWETPHLEDATFKNIRAVIAHDGFKGVRI